MTQKGKGGMTTGDIEGVFEQVSSNLGREREKKTMRASLEVEIELEGEKGDDR